MPNELRKPMIPLDGREAIRVKGKRWGLTSFPVRTGLSTGLPPNTQTLKVEE